MKLVICGKNNIAVKITEFLYRENDILIVPAKTDLPIDGWQKSLTKKGIELGIDVLDNNINTESNILKITNFQPDYIISLQYDRIIRKDVINIPYSVLNLHFSLLPLYRGVAPIAHAMIDCEEKTGVSLHYIDEGTDTGDLIAQAETEIEENDTGRSLYEKLTKVGIELFTDNYENMSNFNLIRNRQDNKKASYYSWRDLNFNENIGWDKSTRQVSCGIRAFIFPPYQFPKIILDRREYDITQIGAVYSNKYEPWGTICDVNEKGITVATTDGYIIIKSLETNGVRVPIESLSENKGRRI